MSVICDHANGKCVVFQKCCHSVPHVRFNKMKAGSHRDGTCDGSLCPVPGTSETVFVQCVSTGGTK